MKACSVTELTKYIKSVLEGDYSLRKILIRGELSNFKRYTSGHCYFTLKDETACLKCVMFRTAASRMKFEPTNGLQVLVEGRVAVYERDGTYQLYTETLSPDGIGDLALAFEQQKERLRAEGLFDPRYKKKIPYFVRRIGIVTSQTGAVLRDIYRVAKRRNPNVNLILYPVQVQGESAAEQIAYGIETLDRNHLADIIIVGRGGGSVEDLWAFNEEKVVRAIFKAQTPIISAVGHETDITLSDFVADLRAATPSQAAELVVCDVRELRCTLESKQLRFKREVAHTLEIKRSRLMQSRQHAFFQIPHLLTQKRRQHLDVLGDTMQKCVASEIMQRNQRVRTAIKRLELLNPLNVLKRGYGIIEYSSRHVRSIDDLHLGDKIEIQLQDGRARANVDRLEAMNIREIFTEEK